MSKGYDRLKERIGRVEKILGIRHKDPTDPEPNYQGPKFERIIPCSTQCTKCGYQFKPEDHRCPRCPEHGKLRMTATVAAIMEDHEHYMKAYRESLEIDRMVRESLNMREPILEHERLMTPNKYTKIYNRLHGINLDCTCPPDGLDGNCPEHGRMKWKELIRDGVNFKPECTCNEKHNNLCQCVKHGGVNWEEVQRRNSPGIPLYARVAEHLGYDVWNDFDSEKWFYRDRLNATEKDPKPWLYIPRYDLDEKLALRALKEYCEKHLLRYQIRFSGYGAGFVVRIGEIQDEISDTFKTDYPTPNKSLSETICLAIDSHATEGKRASIFYKRREG